MKLLVLYRPNSEYSRGIETFIHDFKRRHETPAERMEVINVDSREGVAMSSLYDIMQQPALMVLADDGSLVKYWEGNQLPLMDEVAGYFYTSQ